MASGEYNILEKVSGIREILKNNWEKENQLLVFSKEEIFEMMRRKSLSISRTLLWIGCLEVVLWILFFYILFLYPYI